MRGQGRGHSSSLPAFHPHPHFFAAVSTLQKGPGFVCGFSGLECNGEDSVESGPFLSQGRMDPMGREAGRSPLHKSEQDAVGPTQGGFGSSALLRRMKDVCSPSCIEATNFLSGQPCCGVGALR